MRIRGPWKFLQNLINGRCRLVMGAFHYQPFDEHQPPAQRVDIPRGDLPKLIQCLAPLAMVEEKQGERHVQRRGSGSQREGAPVFVKCVKLTSLLLKGPGQRSVKRTVLGPYQQGLAKTRYRLRKLSQEQVPSSQLSQCISVVIDGIALQTSRAFLATVESLVDYRDCLN
jgi:hypothetical protein